MQTNGLDHPAAPGFTDHGVGAMIASARGIVATADAQGRDMVLTWLSDCRGCYALLAIDAATGESETLPVPAPPGDTPFASCLSSRNRFYTLFNAHFLEFDPCSRKFTLVRTTTPRVGMGMTEDDAGRIWTVTYPDSGVVMFDPERKEFRDYGAVYNQNWPQYQRTVAADDTGWIYFAVGNTRSQLIAFDPKNGNGTPLMPDSERVPNVSATVTRDVNGKVYALTDQRRGEGPWLELYCGRITKTDVPAPPNPKPIIAGLQNLCHRNFPSGNRLEKLDLVTRELTVRDARADSLRRISFKYASEGNILMGVAATPDGAIMGDASRSVHFDPTTNQWTSRAAYGQWNTLASQEGRFFIGGYTGGYLLEWDPTKPWIDTRKDNAGSNPRFLTECAPDINRPHALLAHPDGRTIVMAGSPGYGYTGGGLLFWDRITESGAVVPHTALLPEHATISLAALPDGNLLVGSGSRAGTGGEVKIHEARLFILDMATKQILWQAALLPGAQEYSELRTGHDGLVYGLADFQPWAPTRYDEAKHFFVFDPQTRTMVHTEDLMPEFGPIHLQQGQRKLVLSPTGEVYLLLTGGIAKVDGKTHKLRWVARSPASITAGGDWLDGRIYFAAGSHLWSFQLQHNQE